MPLQTLYAVPTGSWHIEILREPHTCYRGNHRAEREKRAGNSDAIFQTYSASNFKDACGAKNQPRHVISFVNQIDTSAPAALTLLFFPCFNFGQGLQIEFVTFLLQGSGANCGCDAAARFVAVATTAELARSLFENG